MTHILLATAAMLALISASAVAADSSGTEATHMVCTDPKKTSADAAYIGGATIIALAAFGSALSARVVVDKSKGKVEKYSTYSIIVGAGIITAAQIAIMWYACCSGTLDQAFLSYLVLTFIGAVLIVGGFVMKMDNQPEESTGTDKGQPPAQDGVSTELHFKFKSGQGTSDMSFNHSGEKS